MPSIYDVAKLAGVSPATVSRAFSKPGRVHEETLARIQEAAESLGYRTKVVTHHAERERTRHIALLVPDSANPFFSDVIRGALSAAAESAYSVLLLDTQESLRREEEDLERVTADVDGILMAAPRIADAPLRAAARERPLIMLNRLLPEVTSLSPNNRQGIHEALGHLHALGHRDIAYLSGPDSSFADEVRWRAMRDFAAEHVLRVHRIGPCNPTLAGGEVAARRFAAGSHTAAICFNDLIALGLIRELTRMGRSVPGDVSVIGIDNIMSSELVTPPLTTVAAPYAALGSVAVHHLVSMISGIRTGQREQLTLPMRLVIRGTTAPLSAA